MMTTCSFGLGNGLKLYRLLLAPEPLHKAFVGQAMKAYPTKSLKSSCKVFLLERGQRGRSKGQGLASSATIGRGSQSFKPEVFQCCRDSNR